MRDNVREVRKQYLERWRFGKPEQSCTGKYLNGEGKRAGDGYTGSTAKEILQNIETWLVTAACLITDVCGATVRSGSGQLRPFKL